MSTPRQYRDQIKAVREQIESQVEILEYLARKPGCCDLKTLNKLSGCIPDLKLAERMLGRE